MKLKVTQWPVFVLQVKYTRMEKHWIAQNQIIPLWVDLSFTCWDDCKAELQDITNCLTVTNINEREITAENMEREAVFVYKRLSWLQEPIWNLLYTLSVIILQLYKGWFEVESSENNVHRMKIITHNAIILHVTFNSMAY
jgi:hypothetical protein